MLAQPIVFVACASISALLLFTVCFHYKESVYMLRDLSQVPKDKSCKVLNLSFCFRCRDSYAVI